MLPRLMIGQTCCYWGAKSQKPDPAICNDWDEDTGTATLTVFTTAGGRFTKAGVSFRNSSGGEGFTEVGQIVRG